MMKPTKYLFNESKSRDGLVSVSQIQTFLSCKKKWEYNYIENLTPRVEKTYLTIGKLCHRGMQTAMQYQWVHGQEKGYHSSRALKAAISSIYEEYNKYLQENILSKEEECDLELTVQDAEKVFRQAFNEFDPDKYEVYTIADQNGIIPALEVHFCVPCSPSKGMQGYIDAILRDKETGFLWCVDYKFRKSFAPDEDEAFNIQNAVYAYACNKMNIPIVGTLTWQHLNTPAADPAVLKDGKISRAKIKTTWKHYASFCLAHNENPADYEEEMVDKLGEIEWFKSTYEYRNTDTINRIWKECITPAVKGIKTAHKDDAHNFRSLYPWNCKMCQYQSLCQAELRNYDAGFIRDNEYIVRSDNKPIDTPDTPMV